MSGEHAQTKPAYRRYTDNQAHMTKYVAYQERYANDIRESDRVTIRLISDWVADHGEGPFDLLDVGCSTGNFLRHVRHADLPLRLQGADLAASALQIAREDAVLEGIAFIEHDIVACPPSELIDVITFNAVFFAFGPEEFRSAVANAAAALRPGGALICWDLFNPFQQRLDIVETSQGYPDGLRIVVRSYEDVREAVAEAGLNEPHLEPFRLPVDLSGGDDPASNQTYSVTSSDGDRLLFRGSLHQPWCHMVARKPA